jgi:hypothetical protein
MVARTGRLAPIEPDVLACMHDIANHVRDEELDLSQLFEPSRDGLRVCVP